MNELVDLAIGWKAFGLALIIFGFLPGAVLNLVLRLYPQGHDRRVELLAELAALPYRHRRIFVVSQFEVAFGKGCLSGCSAIARG